MKRRGVMLNAKACMVKSPTKTAGHMLMFMPCRGDYPFFFLLLTQMDSVRKTVASPD
jgi:hypothetical protein